MTVYVADTETTGGEPPEVIELAYRHWDDSGIPIVERFCPSGPILWGALATHHILREELEGCPGSANARLPADTQYLIGHNVDYDWKALGSPDVRRICTLAMARKMFPLVDSHSLGAMYYFFFGANELSRSQVQGAHGAAVDVILCGAIFASLLTEAGLADSTDEEIWRFSEECRVPDVISFGKHKGMKIVDLPWDYRKWILRQDDMDEYLKTAVRRTMK